MDYATFADLVRVSVDGWIEIAQRATRDPRVSAELFQAAAEGADTSAWPVEVAAVALSGAGAVRTQLGAASRYADGFIGGRYPGGLTPDQVAASDLPTVVATIALRRMYGAAVDEAVLKATRWADDFLKAVADGTANLVPASVAPAEADAEVLYHFSPRSVTDDDLRGFA